MYDDGHMMRAIALSRRALEEPGCEPFAAVIVRDGVIIGEGLNRAEQRHDPTAHGEVEAIRDACRRLGSRDLSGADLYSTCEPCALCTATMMIAGIARLYYGVSLDQSRAALGHLPQAVRRYPMPADVLRAEVGLPVEARRMPAWSHRADEARAVLDAWAQQKAGRS